MDSGLFTHLVIAFIIVVPIVLISRSVVAGTRYSPILIIVIFGLSLGVLLVASGAGTRGLPEFPVVQLLSQVTIVALLVSFFVGGQELRKIMTGQRLEIEELVSPSQEEVVLGTRRTQMFYIVRSVCILLGVWSLYRLVPGSDGPNDAGPFTVLLAWIGTVFSVILIDSRAAIRNKPLYLRKGLIELAALVLVLLASREIAVAVRETIALPQIFFAMLISCSIGMLLPHWQFGPTVRALLFAGIPVVLAANFLVGGSRLAEAFALQEMQAVMGYGFFGQVFWMFAGISLLAWAANHVRNIAPGMAGALSHSGLTGACTAGDMGQDAAARAPIMINVPFIGHIFVFSILAHSASENSFAMLPIVGLTLVGGMLVLIALRLLKKAEGAESAEVRSLMLFSLGWQLAAVFGSFAILGACGMSIENAAMSVSSALSHFGLFAATQGGMFGEQTASMIPFIFAMPFLVHPVVFGIFGKAITNGGAMPFRTAVLLALIGTGGIILSLSMI